MTHFWDKFGGPIRRLEDHALTPEDRVKLSRYLELLGELLAAREEYVQLRVPEYEVGKKNSAVPLPQLLTEVGKALRNATPKQDEALATILAAATCGELHSFDHRDIPFKPYPAIGHHTEQYLRWLLESRSAQISPELRAKAKEFSTLDYPAERRLWD